MMCTYVIYKVNLQFIESDLKVPVLLDDIEKLRSILKPLSQSTVLEINEIINCE